MHKCFKCGTEFDGKFCPNCGSEWEEEKVCPQCGAKLGGEARFCTQCGYSFAGKAENAIKPQSDMQQKLFSALRFLPFAALALFSVLLFAFFAAPVAELVMGAGFPNVSLGNVYSMQSGILSELPQLNGSLVSLIFFTVIAFIYACAFGAVRFVRGYEFKRIKIAKFEISLASLLDYVSFVFYLIVFIIGVTVMGMISSADEGMGLLVSGACPILLIVFSIVFALLAAGSLVARFLLAKKYPELAREEKMREERYLQAEKERKAQYYATHTAPVPPIMTGQPKKEYIRSAVIYRHDKRRYDKAKEGKTPAAVIWIDLHMAAVLSVAAILLVAIILISVLVPIFTNKFRVSVVEKINLGDNREQVIKILGEPNETLYNDACWQFYSDEYNSIQQKIAKNIEKQEQAIEKGDEKMLLRLADEELKLEEQLQTVKYDFIEIEFSVKNENELSVSSVFFEKNRCDSATESTKTVKKYSVLLETFSQNNKLPYRTYFTDGSYYSSYAQPAVKDISGNSVGLIWSDKFYSEYETYTNFSEVIIAGVCYINSNNFEIPSEDKNSITSLTIMDGVTSIGWNAFQNCTNLESVHITDIAAWCNIEFGSNPLSYAHNLYLNNQLVTELTAGMLQGVTQIKHDAFYGCTSLESVTIGNSVTSIGDDAFYGCTSLKSITIPDSVTSIGKDAFENCTNLESVHITDIAAWCNIDFGDPDANLLLYAHNLYLDNQLVTELTAEMLQGVTTIKSYAFAGFGGTSITIPDSVTSIGDETFDGCTSLESVTIGNSVTSIGEYAFAGCTSLESVTIGNSVTSIGDDAFSGCTSLISITIPDSVTSIGEWAFSGCESLTRITIGNGVTSIVDYAFYGCTSLASISIPDSVTSIGYHAFDGCTNLTSVTIPNSVTSIGDDAFRDCESLESITIGNGVTSIGDDAFSGCTSLISITIPDSVTSIGDYAFYGCRSLESITIPNSVTSIGDEAFYYWCDSLKNVTFNNPNGWYVAKDPWDTSGIDIPSEDLQNPETAAEYLKDTYGYYYWIRKTT